MCLIEKSVYFYVFSAFNTWVRIEAVMTFFAITCHAVSLCSLDVRVSVNNQAKNAQVPIEGLPGPETPQAHEAIGQVLNRTARSFWDTLKVLGFSPYMAQSTCITHACGDALYNFADRVILFGGAGNLEPKFVAHDQ